MKTTLVLILLVVSVAALSGCNTTKGAGKDLQSAGEGIENSAERNGAK